MVHVLGVSMPRSGHHLFEMILKNTLGDQFSYCEYYEQGCCHSIPCTSKVRLSTRQGDIFMQKSHDFSMTDPVVVPGAHRVVQYRSPVPRALSNYELHLKNGSADTVSNFRGFLVAETLYFERFYRKWLMNRPREYFILSYEELTGDPVKATLDFFEHIKMPIDVARVDEGVARSVGRRGRDNAAFTHANVYSHRYAQVPVLANFEDLIHRNCPGYYPTRYFSTVDSSKSIIGLMFSARKAVNDRDRKTAMAFAEAASKEAPDDPVVKRILGTAMRVDEEAGTSKSASGANDMAEVL